MKRILLLALAISLIAGCASTMNVQPYNPASSSNPDGVIYALPRTVVEVTVPVARSQTQLTKFGIQFCQEVNSKDSAELNALESRFGLDCESYKNNYKKVNVGYGIGEPTIATRAEADPNQIFVVSTDAEDMEDLTLNMELTENCLLCNGDSSVTQHGVDYAVKTIEVAAGLTKTIMFGAPKALDVRKIPEKPGYVLNQARAIGKNLDKIYKRKLALISNQDSSMQNPEVFKLMLAELQKEERAQLANLVSSKRILWTAQLDIIPKQDFETVSLFKLDRKNGVFEAHKDLQVPDAFKTNTTNPTKNHLVTVSFERGQNQMVDKIQETQTTEERGFYYRIPACACATISVDNTVKTKKRLQIAQLGKVVSLPSTRGTYKASSGVTFHTDTGALKKVNMTESAPPAEAISQIGAAGQSLLDARAASLQAEELANDELTKLQRQYDLMLLQKQIEALQAGNIPTDE